MHEQYQNQLEKLADTLVTPERTKNSPRLSTWKSEATPNYHKIHRWMYSNFGKASRCENCSLERKVFQWSNISGNYKLERSDWRELCASCHVKFDNTPEELAKRTARIAGINRRGVLQINEGTGECIAMFRSAAEAAAYYGVVRTAIVACLSGRIQRVKGFKWEYGQ